MLVEVEVIHKFKSLEVMPFMHELEPLVAEAMVLQALRLRTRGKGTLQPVSPWPSVQELWVRPCLEGYAIVVGLENGEWYKWVKACGVCEGAEC